LAGMCGYDFVLIDGEHGPGDVMTHLDAARAVSATPATSVLRVAANDPVLLKRALDLGVEGVMIPSINSVDEARAAVAACRYPPQGRRGSAVGIVRASDYGLRTVEYVEAQAAELLIILQIETVSGAAHAAEIAAVDGVDAIMIGPYDLSGDLGIPGEFDHPRFIETIEGIERDVLASGTVLATLPFPTRSLDALRRRGYRMLALGADVALLRDGLVANLQAGRAAFEG
jgi:4-hydroxy-2-oxoheptanedioate aldolase